MVLGAPGHGVTSLLLREAAALEDDGRPVARLSAWSAETPDELLDAITEALTGPLAAQVGSGDAVQAAYQRLSGAVLERPGSVVVIDDLPAVLGHRVFGQMRDEIWELDVQWLVGARIEDGPVLLQPPADAFFETVVRLPDFTADEITRALQIRDPDSDLHGAVKTDIAEASRGDMSRALALAREALVSGQLPSSQSLEPLARERLGEPAARLIAELEKSGPSSPSDQRLLSRMGWSVARAHQVFTDLEAAGLVVSSAERTGRPGRPRKVYAVRRP